MGSISSQAKGIGELGLAPGFRSFSQQQQQREKQSSFFFAAVLFPKPLHIFIFIYLFIYDGMK
jgi:hypothetical protein